MYDYRSKRVYVNREQERGLFQEMLKAEVSAHILLLQADAGMGKSSLMRTLWDECKHWQGDTIGRARLDFKDNNLSAAGVVMGELCQQLGRQRFTEFYKEADAYARVASVNVQGSTFIDSSLDATLVKLNPEQRKMRQQMLTDAFFTDLEKGHDKGPVVLLFDTFEKAQEEVREWLSGPFLTRVRPHQWLVMVVAGRETPAVDTDWEDWRLHHTLRPLNREYVGEYLRRVELSLSDSEINLIYDLTDGNPLELATYVKKLLIKRGNQRR